MGEVVITADEARFPAGWYRITEEFANGRPFGAVFAPSYAALPGPPKPERLSEPFSYVPWTDMKIKRVSTTGDNFFGIRLSACDDEETKPVSVETSGPRREEDETEHSQDGRIRVEADLIERLDNTAVYQARAIKVLQADAADMRKAIGAVVQTNDELCQTVADLQNRVNILQGRR